MARNTKSVLTLVSALVIMLLATFIFAKPEEVLAKVSVKARDNYTYVTGKILTESGKPIKNGVVKIAVVQRIKVKGKYVNRTVYLASDRSDAKGVFSLRFRNYHNNAKFIVFIKAQPRSKEIRKTINLELGQDLKFTVKVDKAWRPILPNPMFVY